VSQLDRELRSLGYKGSRRSLYRFVATFESSSTTSGEEAPEASEAALALSVSQATWLFFAKRPIWTRRNNRIWGTFGKLIQASRRLITWSALFYRCCENEQVNT
jgi:hypothetical protein